ncbi:MAG TPA: acyl-CoA dehydrogenase domain-containing protein, partial [Arenicellales bacterium]|nr:acyl-CoA dehydrogenase domain-containing protein [Arenicellales bacterium]
DRLTAGMYLADRPDDPVGSLEDALRKVVEVEPLLRRLREQGQRYEPAPELEYRDWVAELVSEGLVEQADADRLLAAREATLRVIAVDHFPPSSSLRDGQSTAASAPAAQPPSDA